MAFLPINFLLLASAVGDHVPKQDPGSWIYSMVYESGETCVDLVNHPYGPYTLAKRSLCEDDDAYFQRHTKYCCGALVYNGECGISPSYRALESLVGRHVYTGSKRMDKCIQKCSICDRRVPAPTAKWSPGTFTCSVDGYVTVGESLISPRISALTMRQCGRECWAQAGAVACEYISNSLVTTCQAHGHAETAARDIHRGGHFCGTRNPQCRKPLGDPNWEGIRYVDLPETASDGEEIPCGDGFSGTIHLECATSGDNFTKNGSCTKPCKSFSSKEVCLRNRCVWKAATYGGGSMFDAYQLVKQIGRLGKMIFSPDSDECVPQTCDHGLNKTGRECLCKVRASRSSAVCLPSATCNMDATEANQICTLKQWSQNDLAVSDHFDDSWYAIYGMNRDAFVPGCLPLENVEHPAWDYHSSSPHPPDDVFGPYLPMPSFQLVRALDLSHQLLCRHGFRGIPTHHTHEIAVCGDSPESCEEFLEYNGIPPGMRASDEDVAAWHKYVECLEDGQGCNQIVEAYRDNFRTFDCRVDPYLYAECNDRCIADAPLLADHPYYDYKANPGSNLHCRHGVSDLFPWCPSVDCDRLRATPAP